MKSEQPRFGKRLLTSSGGFSVALRLEFLGFMNVFGNISS